MIPINNNQPKNNPSNDSSNKNETNNPHQVNGAYEKPVMIKMQNGCTNKFGSSPSYARKVFSEIDGVSIDDLTGEYGSPLFVFSEGRLRRRYRELYRAFSTRYPNVQFGWSYKTNYLPAVCAVLHQEGAIAEVVSQMEYQKARSLGIPGERIVFNGPHKGMDILKRAASEGAAIHIDHLEELYDLERVADELGKPLKVGLRLNMDTGIHPQWFRFGFNLESGQALDAVQRMAEKGKLILDSLHCHIGTYILDPGAYDRLVTKMVRFAYQVEDFFGFRIDTLDIGGGFPSRSKLKSSYHAPDLVVPDLGEYAEAVSGALYRSLRPGHYPRLMLESGRAMIDEAGFLVTSIFASKRLPDGRMAYIADAGINLLFTSTWYTYNIDFDRPLQGPDQPSVIYGPMCMNIDVIKESTMLPPLERGTRLILSPVGAYNVTQWLQFIEYRPNVVMISEKGEVHVIRQREDLSDIARRECLPEHLNLPGTVPGMYDSQAPASETSSRESNIVPFMPQAPSRTSAAPLKRAVN